MVEIVEKVEIDESFEIFKDQVCDYHGQYSICDSDQVFLLIRIEVLFQINILNLKLSHIPCHA